jgi:hypothetical protein
MRSAPGRAGNREAITPAVHRLPGGEHGRVHVGEDLPGMLEKQSTRARQPHPSAAAVEQPDLDLFLELLDLLTERRLRHVQPFGGTREKCSSSATAMKYLR